MKISPWLYLGILASSFVISSSVKAQITVDGTTNTILDSNGNSIIINEGDRAGDNLFHSFEQFSIPTGGEAFFNNAVNITNIFSRVTGGNISNIDGILRANGGANLFIINPAGIVFGEGASINIGGSFFASTAESIVFSDDIEFSATDADSKPLLTINQPLGLNLGNNPGNIAVNGSVLQVNSGETLALIGGNVTFTAGQIIAPGANIEIGGLTQTGQVSFTQSEDAFSSLNFPTDIARGDVTLTNGTYIDVQAEDGGNITFNANNIELSGGEFGFSSLFAGIAFDSGSPNAQAGDITLNATGNIDITQESGIANNVEEFGRGNSGNIEINTTNLNITNGGYIFASVSGKGNSGTIAIAASDTITIDGEGSQETSAITTLTFEEEGDGADINITTANLFLTNGAEINSGTATIVKEDAGDINITTDNLSLTNGAAIYSSTFNIGNGGDISINASDTITMDGEGSSEFFSTSSIFTFTQGEGNAGNIDITTANLLVTNGANINSGTLTIGNGGNISIDASDTITIDGQGSSGVSTIITQVNEGEGDAGDINIITTNLFVTNGADINSATFTIGNAGDISIIASDTITIDGESSSFTVDGESVSGIPSGISTQTGDEEGDAGNIDITTANLLVTNGALIDSNTFAIGNAGDISIIASDTITIDGENSLGFLSNISTRAGAGAGVGEGDAGDINISTANLFVTNGASIISNTSTVGDGGEIEIIASDTITIDGESSFGSASGIFSQVEENATGEAEEIRIFTDSLLLRNGAEIAVDSQGQASAGNLTIDANTLSLDNSSLLASTPVGEGGRISLEISDTLILRDNSSITARALESANGGNVIIDAGSIVAFPNQNNDIIAAAEQGRGGRIDITTSAIFGLAEGNSTITNLTNDLDASSEFGIAGTISINEIETNPAEGLEELPVEVIDVARLVAQNLCQQGRGSEFVVTGKGGISPSPSQTRDGNIEQVDLVEPVIEEVEKTSLEKKIEENPKAEKEIVEAQGWIVSDRGTIELVAHSTDNNFSSQLEKLCP